MGRGIRQYLYSVTIVALVLLFPTCDDIALLTDTIDQSQQGLFTGIYPAAEGEWIENRTPNLQWDIVADAVSYELQIADSVTGVIEAEVLSVDTNEYTFTTVLNKGDTVYWRLRAKNSTSQPSIWSDIFSFSIPEYFIGEEGPAGGIVFYYKDEYSDNWLFLEAAPKTTEWSNTPWGPCCEPVNGAVGSEVGTGIENTAAFIAKHEAGSTYAAQLCDGLTFTGYSDWFLPSSDELNLIYTNLYLNNIGDFADDYYWSSYQPISGNFSNSAYAKNFGNVNARVDYNKEGNGYVRAIRMF